MPSITDARLKELVALAEKATGTDWADAYIPRSSNWQPTGYVVAVDADQTPVIAVVHPDAKVKAFGTLSDAAFIAAANPATVKAMAQALLEARLLLQESLGLLAYLNSDPQLMPTGKAKVNDAMHRIELLLRPESLKASQP